MKFDATYDAQSWQDPRIIWRYDKYNTGQIDQYGSHARL